MIGHAQIGRSSSGKARDRVASAAVTLVSTPQDARDQDALPDQAFRFRPWVRRAGLSIVAVSAAATAVVATTLYQWPETRFGWMGERFVWVYLGTLWIGGLRVWLGSRGVIAELRSRDLFLRPLHTFRARSIPWTSVRGTEQMIGGDRLIVYHDTPRGMRFVALNLNLVRGRREFLAILDQRLRAMGFVEKVVERSRYLTAPALRTSQ